MEEIITITGSEDQLIEKTITDPQATVKIIAEHGARGTVSVVFDPKDNAEIALHIHVQPQAHITVLCLQATSGNITLKQTTKIEEGAHLKLQNITLGSKTEQSVSSELQGKNAVSDIDWIFYARNQDHQTISAENIFGAPAGGGQITMKGVAEESAHVACNGMINIGKEGTGTDTYLTEDVLMLDKSAKVDAVPGLEIKTNDVSASHSATVSKVTPEDLFYFASRGIDQTEARAMYVQGFLSDLTQNILHENLRDAVNASISAKFGADR